LAEEVFEDVGAGYPVSADDQRDFVRRIHVVVGWRHGGFGELLGLRVKFRVEAEGVFSEGLVYKTARKAKE
jgi:hypothetical protein